MVVLGLGIGMVMQVLVLAAQNAVDYRLLGVATSGATLARQIGGSMGVAAFGSIFANRLAGELAARLPAGARVPADASPSVIHDLPGPVRSAYAEAVTAALQPIFLAAAGVCGLAFLLSFALREVPLRATAGAEGVGEGFASPRDDDSLRELERQVSVLAERENRWELYERLAARAGLALPPPELWLLARVGERAPVAPARLRDELAGDPEELDAAREGLVGRGLVRAVDGGRLDLTPDGRAAHDRIVEGRRGALAELADGWGAEREPEVAALLDRLAHAFVREIPSPRMRAGAGGRA
jgi:hypothetical protein